MQPPPPGRSRKRRCPILRTLDDVRASWNSGRAILALGTCPALVAVMGHEDALTNDRFIRYEGPGQNLVTGFCGREVVQGVACPGSTSIAASSSQLLLPRPRRQQLHT